jgi:hypothetical protein
LGKIGSWGGGLGGYRTGDLRREDSLDRVSVWVQELAGNVAYSGCIMCNSRPT